MFKRLPRRAALFIAQVEKLESRQLLAAHVAGNSAVYATIQAAVDAAAAGATINVDAGTYPELVTINKTLTLKGAQAGKDARGRSASESVVRGQLLGSGDRSTSFYVTANNVTIDGFTVQDDSSSNTRGAGIVLAPGVSGTHIVNNIIQHNVAGLFLSSASAANATLIQHNVFAANNNAGTLSGRAIYTDGGISGGNLTNVVIDSNTFTSNSGPDKIEAAISLETQAQGAQSNITITNNTFTNNGKAVLLINASNVTFAGNTVSGSTDVGSGAVRIEGGVSHMKIAGNSLANNQNAAIRIDRNFSAADNSDITINGNNITANAQGGLKIDASAYVGTLDARNNWWGSSSGPGGDGPGSGQGIFANGVPVNFTPWATAPLTLGAQPTPTPPPPPPPPPPPTPSPTPTPSRGHHHKKHKPRRQSRHKHKHHRSMDVQAVVSAARHKKHKPHRAASRKKKHHHVDVAAMVKSLLT